MPRHIRLPKTGIGPSQGSGMRFGRIETRLPIGLALLAAPVFLAGSTGLAAEDGLVKIRRLRKQGEYAQAA